MRAISARGTSRLPLRSITPTMPHMALPSLAWRERLVHRQRNAGAREGALVEVGVIGDHACKAEALLGHLARRLGVPPRGRALGEVGKQRSGECVRIGRR